MTGAEGMLGCIPSSLPRGNEWNVGELWVHSIYRWREDGSLLRILLVIFTLDVMDVEGTVPNEIDRKDGKDLTKAKGGEPIPSIPRFPGKALTEHRVQHEPEHRRMMTWLKKKAFCPRKKVSR